MYHVTRPNENTDITIRLKNNIGMVKEANVGFSWTTLFFGYLVAMFRGDWKYAGIQFLLALITCGISTLVFPFIYNKLYIKDLLEKGYMPLDESDRTILVQKGFIII